MKRTLSVLLIVLTFFITNSQNKKSFRIDGEIVGNKKNGRITIDLKEFDMVKKARVKNGKFTFEGNIPNTTMARIDFDGFKSVPFYIEHSDMKLTLKLKKIYFSEIIKDYVEMWVVTNIENCLTESLRREYDTFFSRIKDNPKSKHLLYSYLSEKIDEHPDNIFYFYKIWILSFDKKYIDVNQLKLIFKKVDIDNIQSKGKNSMINQINKNLNL